MSQEHRLVKRLREFAFAVKVSQPLRQSVVRRMTVKGETVYTRETFMAPARRARRKA